MEMTKGGRAFYVHMSLVPTDVAKRMESRRRRKGSCFVIYKLCAEKRKSDLSVLS